MKNKMNNINPNSTTEVNNYIDDMSMTLVLEAVKHFKKHFRKADPYDFDERYFYNKNELALFLKLNTNPEVNYRTEYYDNCPEKIFCYVVYRN